MDNEMKKLQALIPAELHTKLKLLSVASGNTMADLTTKALEDLIKRTEDRVNVEPEGEFCACADPDCKGDHR